MSASVETMPRRSISSSVVTMPRVPRHRRRTDILWNADSWLPDRYQDPYFICQSIARSLLKRRLYRPFVSAFGDAEKFPDELKDVYHEYTGFATFKTPKGSEHERLHLMLVKLVLLASADKHRESQLVIVAKLSQDSQMICRVLASLVSRGCRVLFALPEVDVDTTSFGITVSEQTVCNDRIPVWLCPNLFDLEWPPQTEQKPEHGDEKKLYFIEPPAPDSHTLNFSMPDHVDTCVFWDVEDYPLPPSLPLGVFYKNILAAVRSRVPSSSGHLSIYAYFVKEPEPVFAPCGRRAVINLVRNAPADRFARVAKITMDFLLWSMDNPTERCYPLLPRPNLLVITKRLENDILRLRSTLIGLNLRGHNVFLALPEEQIPPAATYDKHDVPLLSWEDLSGTGTGKRKRECDSY